MGLIEAAPRGAPLLGHPRVRGEEQAMQRFAKRGWCSAAGWGVLLLTLTASSGCANRDKTVMRRVQEGEFAKARVFLEKGLEDRKSSRSYMLERMYLSMVDLADGLPDSAEQTVAEVYEILRTQGINKDRTVASVVISEDVRFWKGEPFEQAMMYYYIALQKALRGEWDNARAAADGSLFLLKSFGDNQKGEDRTTEQIAADAARQDLEEAKYELYVRSSDVAFDPTWRRWFLGAQVLNNRKNKPAGPLVYQLRLKEKRGR
jgi:hypothetical protein